MNQYLQQFSIFYLRIYNKLVGLNKMNLLLYSFVTQKSDGISLGQSGINEQDVPLFTEGATSLLVIRYLFLFFYLSLCSPSSIFKASKVWWSHFNIYNLHFPFFPHVSEPAHKNFPHFRAPAFRLGSLKESKVTVLCLCLIIPAKSLCHVKPQIQALK